MLVPMVGLEPKIADNRVKNGSFAKEFKKIPELSAQYFSVVFGIRFGIHSRIGGDKKRRSLLRVCHNFSKSILTDSGSQRIQFPSEREMQSALQESTQHGEASPRNLTPSEFN